MVYKYADNPSSRLLVRLIASSNPDTFIIGSTGANSSSRRITSYSIHYTKLYETGREMMQIELDKNREQLAKTIKLKETILSIDTTKKYTKAEFGSIIETNNGIYFISIPFGKIKIENTEYFALSAASPIGKAFAENRITSYNVCYTKLLRPFMEGNGRSARIWLDLILKKRLKKCVDWSKISKADYMNAMIQSPTNSIVLKKLLEKSLTNKIDDREMFMKGIDYSYYYEEND